MNFYIIYVTVEAYLHYNIFPYIFYSMDPLLYVAQYCISLIFLLINEIVLTKFINFMNLIKDKKSKSKSYYLRNKFFVFSNKIILNKEFFNSLEMLYISQNDS